LVASPRSVASPGRFDEREHSTANSGDLYNGAVTLRRSALPGILIAAAILRFVLVLLPSPATRAVAKTKFFYPVKL
jgi:hypothetical protein